MKGVAPPRNKPRNPWGSFDHTLHAEAFQSMRFWNEDDGQSMVLTAVFMAILSLGFLALAVDTGLLFREKRIVQSAANAAAMGAANELAAGRTSTEQAVANRLASLNGVSSAPALSTLTTLNGVSSQYVQATVTQSMSTPFLSAFDKNLALFPVSASAVAGGANASSTCVCLEGASGEDLYLYGGAEILASTCGIVVDSTSSNAAVMNNGSSIDALSVGVASTSWQASGSNWINSSGSIQYTVPGASSCAPTMPTPPAYNAGSCSAAGASGSAATFGPSSPTGVICYTNLFVGYNGVTDTLKPGIYVITGYLTFAAGANGVTNKGGGGVFFYLTSTGQLTIDNGANINLTSGGSLESDGSTTAPSTGYNGVLFYQPAGNTKAVTIQGGATSFVNGALYAPSAALNISNGSSTKVTMDVVAQTLTMYGGAVLKSGVSSNVDEGSLIIGHPRLVQ
jgi:Flp pilus assembly protein TadG